METLQRSVQTWPRISDLCKTNVLFLERCVFASYESRSFKMKPGPAVHIKLRNIVWYQRLDWILQECTCQGNHQNQLHKVLFFSFFLLMVRSYLRWDALTMYVYVGVCDVLWHGANTVIRCFDSYYSEACMWAFTRLCVTLMLTPMTQSILNAIKLIKSLPIAFTLLWWNIVFFVYQWSK